MLCFLASGKVLSAQNEQKPLPPTRHVLWALKCFAAGALSHTKWEANSTSREA